MTNHFIRERAPGSPTTGVSTAGQLSMECPSMTSVRKKTSSEIFRTPRWLRGTPKSLRSIINPEEVSIHSRMRKAIIQELRPKTPIEWILVQ